MPYLARAPLPLYASRLRGRVCIARIVLLSIPSSDPPKWLFHSN